MRMQQKFTRNCSRSARWTDACRLQHLNSFHRILAVCLPIIICCLAGFIAVPAEKKAPLLEDLVWMVGSWVERKGETETEEYWIAPKGGVMLGVNRTTRTNVKTSFEFMRVATTPAGISYFASPQGRPATEFPLKEQSEKRVVFENLQHDFPQRIIYWLEGDARLCARIEGVVKGENRRQEWRWEKAR